MLSISHALEICRSRPLRIVSHVSRVLLKLGNVLAHIERLEILLTCVLVDPISWRDFSRPRILHLIIAQSDDRLDCLNGENLTWV